MSKTRVYVGGLPEDVRERDIERFFRGYGRICEILLKNGFCFVEFTHSRDADDAIHDLNGKKLLGNRVILQNARNKLQGRNSRYGSGRSTHRFSPARRTQFKAIVENLSSKVQWQDLKDFLTKVGKVTYAKAHNVKEYQGMVEFDTYDDLKNVIEELDGAKLCGRRVSIKECKARSRSRSRSSRPVPSRNYESSSSKRPREEPSRSSSPKNIPPRDFESSSSKRPREESCRSKSPKNIPSRDFESSSSKRPCKESSRSRSPKNISSENYEGSSSKRPREESEERSRSRSNLKRTKKSESKSKSPEK